MRKLDSFESLSLEELTEINGGCSICDFIEDLADAIIDAAMSVVDFVLAVE